MSSAPNGCGLLRIVAEMTRPELKRTVPSLSRNADVTVVIERPRVAPHLAAMRDAMASALGIDPELLSVKAKSNDGIGPVGEGDAVAALAIVLVEVPEKDI